MIQKKMFTTIAVLLVFIPVTRLHSDVPPARIHQPDVPYFLESMNFQTMQMLIFPEFTAGMVVDPYSDLIWNPAYILRQKQKSVYLDFGVTNNLSLPADPVFSQYDNYYNYYAGSLILPEWYTMSSINTVKTSPLYRFAAMMPLGSKMSLGIISRSIFDKETFRSAPKYTTRGGWYSSSDAYSYADSTPERMEVDENQQTVFGTQTEIILGYKLSKRVDLGLRLGHYSYSSDGSLYDSKEGIYPHSSFDYLDDESIKTDGHHIEAGIGIVFHLGVKTRLGFYGGLTRGKSTEEISAQDKTDTWSERDTNPDYYSIYQYGLDRNESYASEGKRPKIAVTFEHDISKKLLFRSFFSYDWSKIDTSGSTAAMKTGSRDRTYDYYKWPNSHFQRYESQYSQESGLSGAGMKHTNFWKWLASFIYVPDKRWAIFGGIQIQKYTLKQEIAETSDYTSESQSKYSLYQPVTYKYYNTYDKSYSLLGEYERLSLFLPVGLKVKVIKDLYVILGTDVTLSLTNQSLESELLYPKVVAREWEDGILIVDDKETDRHEEYRSTPAKDFNKSLGQRFGIVYEHSSGLKLFLGSYGDIFHTANWSFGFEMNW